MRSSFWFVVIAFGLGCSSDSRVEPPATEPKPIPAEPQAAATDKPGGVPAGVDKPAAPDPENAATPRNDVAGNPNWELEPVAREQFEKGQYKEALDTYTRWRPSSFCGNWLVSMHGERNYRIALCHAHLKDHAAAVRFCLAAAGRTDWVGESDEFLVQLYQEAGQLDDLATLLDVIEKAELDQQPKPLTPEERATRVRQLRTQRVRYELDRAKKGDVKPWPEDVPKPKPGSLPKSLPK